MSQAETGDSHDAERPLPLGKGMSVRPAPVSILIRSFRSLVWCGVLMGAWWFGRGPVAAQLAPFGFGWAADILLWLALLHAAYRVGYEALLWWSRLYTLDGDRITSRSGVLRRVHSEAPLRNIQQIVVDRTLAERIFGLGTILVTTAGSHRISVAWVMVAGPARLVAAVRAGMNDARPVPVWLTDDPNAPSGPLVIGLVGGIGAGKSRVAAVLGTMGYIVVDADRDAKAALDRPEVRDALVRWWGKGVLNAEGRIDRAAVAKIVFADPPQRTRLEELVHPLVKAKRADLVERAASEGRAGVVIDAPLLYEAGSDAECDVVFFVDAPRAVRLERVASRGWSEAELDRREKAQLPLEDKKRRADIVVSNAGDQAALEAAVRRAVEEAQRKARMKNVAPPA